MNIRNFACLAVILMCRCCLAEEPNPAQQRVVKTLHILMVFDDHANFAENLGIIKDKENWVRAFSTIGSNLKLQPGEDFTLKVLSADEVTPENIRTYFDGLRLRPQEDGVFFLYCGHGIEDPQLGHVLQLHGNRQISRQENRQRIQVKEPALTVLITDSCSEQTPSLPKFYDLPAEPKGQRMCKSLFYHHRGLVDINATQSGQLAFGHSQTGGNFSQAFRRLLYGATMNNAGTDAKLRRIDAENSWQDVTWSQFVGLLRNELQEISAVNQDAAQVPLVFSLPGGYLGVRTRNLEEQGRPEGIYGILVNEVQANSPAQQSGLLGFHVKSLEDIKAELIIAINGVPVRSIHDFEQLIDRGDGHVSLTLLDPFLGDKRTVATRLQPVQY
jgi:Caspase domain